MLSKHLGHQVTIEIVVSDSANNVVSGAEEPATAAVDQPAVNRQSRPQSPPEETYEPVEQMRNADIGSTGAERLKDAFPGSEIVDSVPD